MIEIPLIWINTLSLNKPHTVEDDKKKKKYIKVNMLKRLLIRK